MMRTAGLNLRVLLFIIIPVFVYNGLQAQMQKPKFQITGTVTDSVSHAGLSYATITIQNGHQEIVKRVASETSGAFTLILDTAGLYNIAIQLLGYMTKNIPVQLDGKTSTTDLGNIPVSPGEQKIGEVAVVAQKPLVKTEADKIVYSVEADPESKTNSALDMLRKVPLVTVDGEDNIQLKGSSNFKFLLNGKSSTMLSQNPKDVLRSMPASTVRDIEVITNPSSKYEAEGTGGIINIITTKKPPGGFMGRVNSSANSWGGFNGGFYVSSAIKRFSFSLTYNLNAFQRPGEGSSMTRENLLSTTNRFTSTEGKGHRMKGLFNYATGEASYEPDSLNLISLSFFAAKGDFNGLNELMTRGSDINRVLVSQFSNRYDWEFGWGYISGNIDFQHTYSKPDKTFTVSYKLEGYPNNRENRNDITGLLNYISYRQKSLNDANGTEHTVQLDYYDPLTKKHQLETGFKYILRLNMSKSDVFLYDSALEDWRPDETRDNNLDYYQHILGVYAGYVLKLEKFSLKTGLRAEATINDGHFESVTDTSFTNKMFNLIPYIMLSQNFGKSQNIKISYTQRLSRPGIWYLNPYIDNTDPLNIQYGNPGLDAEVTHAFEVSYGKFTEKFNATFSLNGSFTNNSIESVSTMQPSGITVTTYENIGKNQRYGSFLYGSAKIGKKLNLNGNLGMTYTFLKSNDSRDLSNKGFNYNSYLNARYMAWKNGTFSGYLGLYSPRIMLQGKTSAFTYSGVTLSQDLMKKKVTLSLSLNNPFTKNLKYESHLEDPAFKQTSTSYYRMRQIRFNASYRFGQMKGEVKKVKRGIRNEDLKSGGDQKSTGPPEGNR